MRHSAAALKRRASKFGIVFNNHRDGVTPSKTKKVSGLKFDNQKVDASKVTDRRRETEIMANNNFELQAKRIAGVARRHKGNPFID